MGLLSLLAAPVTGPLKGFTFVIRQIQQYVEKELYDLSRLQEKLLKVRMNYERGLIDEDEYQETETRLLKLIREARQRQEALLEEAEEKMNNLGTGQQTQLGGLQVQMREEEDNENP